MSVYKAFEHQHVPEIKQSLRQLQNSSMRKLISSPTAATSQEVSLQLSLSRLKWNWMNS